MPFYFRLFIPFFFFNLSSHYFISLTPSWRSWTPVSFDYKTSQSSNICIFSLLFVLLLWVDVPVPYKDQPIYVCSESESLSPFGKLCFCIIHLPSVLSWVSLSPQEFLCPYVNMKACYSLILCKKKKTN